MANITKRPRQSIMSGIRYPEKFSPQCFKEALEYKPKPGDVFISTYPRSGTTWMQNIAFYIFRKGRELDDPTEFTRLAPFIDMMGLEGVVNMPRPGAIKTHLPYSHMPYSSDAKYILVARNPRDCCVSSYRHYVENPGFGYWDATFDEFFELFIAGELFYNDYFDHLLHWYPHRNDPNVFYTTYESIKKDKKNVVLKLSKFLGQEYIDAIEKDNSILNNILHYTEIDYMKKKLTAVYDTEERKDHNSYKSFAGLRYVDAFTKSLNPPSHIRLKDYVRKGIIGDWKNYFSADQIDRLNKKCLEKLKDTEILQWFPLE